MLPCSGHSLSRRKVQAKMNCCVVCVNSCRPLYTRLIDADMNPKCRSSKQQPYPRLERLGLVAVESTDAVLLDDVHSIIRRSSMVRGTYPCRRSPVE